MTILLEKISPPDPSQKLPRCIKGKRACTPDDVGGVWGYDGFVEALQDSTHSEHETYKLMLRSMPVNLSGKGLKPPCLALAP